MRLTEVRGVGSGTAETIHDQLGFSTAEELAYGFGPDIVDCDGVDAPLYLNAQKLVAEKSDLRREEILSQQKYYCSHCETKFSGLKSFSTPQVCSSHMQSCDDCPPGVGDV